MFLETIEAYVDLIRRRARSERGFQAVAHTLSIGSAVVIFGASFALWADVARSPLTLLLAIVAIGVALLAQSVSVILRREARAVAGRSGPMAGKLQAPAE